MQLPSKKPQDYNAKDIFNIFATLYNDKFGREYIVSRFIGHEMACAVFNGVRANDRSVNIPYIMAGLRYYIPATSSKLFWFVHMDGTDEIKKKWKRREILGATWLPDASQNGQLKQISEDLRVWANEKEKQYAGTTNKKRGTRKSS